MIPKKQNKTIVRNITQTVTFTAEGDYRGDAVYFTAKKTRKVSDTKRIIDHLVDRITYDSESKISTFESDLVPSETSSIDLPTLFFDLMKENSSIDHKLIISGDLAIKQGVRLDSDVAPNAPTPIIILNLDDESDLEKLKNALGLTTWFQTSDDNLFLTNENKYLEVL